MDDKSVVAVATAQGVDRSSVEPVIVPVDECVVAGVADDEDVRPTAPRGGIAGADEPDDFDAFTPLEHRRSR
jgi:hypothetical protein